MKIPNIFTCAVMLALCPFAHAATTLTFDFGSPATPNINNFSGNMTVSNPVIDGSGNLNGVSLVLSGSTGTNGSGTATPSGALALFAGTTTQDSIYGDVNNTTLTLAITGLNPVSLYSFEFGASRISAGGDIRTALYSISGLNSSSAVLNASENASNTATVSNITPTAEGDITITITKDAATNTSTSGFFYIGGMQMTVVPEPSGALLVGLSSMVLLLRRRR